MVQRFILVPLLLVGLSPAVTSAQQTPENRFSIEPFAGAYFDNSFSGSEFDLANRGVIAGVRLGYALSERARLTADLGYAEVNGIGRAGTPANYVIYGQDQWIAIGGAEYDVFPGRQTSASFGLQGGVLSRGFEVEHTVGEPGRFAEHLARPNSTPFPVVVPSVTVRHLVTRRIQVEGAIQDYMILDDNPTISGHSLAVTLGLSFQ